MNHALKPMKSAGIVGLGKIGQGLMALATTALAARTLGVHEFGLLMLVHSMVFGLSQILRFQTWQAVIRYGAQSLEQSQAGRFKKLIRFCYRLDWLAAAVGLVIILLAIGPVSRWFGLADDMTGLAQIYGVSIVFMILTPTPLGILRLLDRFDLIAWQTLIAPAVRFLGALGFFLIGGGLLEFLSLWFAASIASRLGLQILAMRELRKLSLWQEKSDPYDGREEGIWRFIFSHNFARGLNVSQGHIGLVLIGGMLGPSAAGIFRVAQQFADVLIKPVNKLLIPAIYPELAKLQAKGTGHEKTSMVNKNMMFAGAIALGVFTVLLLAGPLILKVIIGEAFLRAYMPMVILALSGLVLVVIFPFEPLLSSAGKVLNITLIYGIALIIYIVNLLAWMPHYGLEGAALASLISALVTGGLFYLSSRSVLKRGAHD